MKTFFILLLCAMLLAPSVCYGEEDDGFVDYAKMLGSWLCLDTDNAYDVYLINEDTLWVMKMISSTRSIVEERWINSEDGRAEYQTMREGFAESFSGFLGMIEDRGYQDKHIIFDLKVADNTDGLSILPILLIYDGKIIYDFSSATEGCQDVWLPLQEYADSWISIFGEDYHSAVCFSENCIWFTGVWPIGRDTVLDALNTEDGEDWSEYERFRNTVQFIDNFRIADSMLCSGHYIMTADGGPYLVTYSGETLFDLAELAYFYCEE